MWELKSKSVRRVTPDEVERNKLPIGRLLMLELSLVFTDGKQDIGVSTFIKSRDEVRNTIKQNLNSLNEQAEIEQEISGDTFKLEVETPEPSAEELVKREERQKEAELQEAIRKARLLKEAEELAQTDDEVKSKLDAFKAK